MKILRLLIFFFGLIQLTLIEFKATITKQRLKIPPLRLPKVVYFQRIDFSVLRALFLVLTFTLWSSIGLTSCVYLAKITQKPIRADFDKLLKGDTVVIKKKTLLGLVTLLKARLT